MAKQITPEQLAASGSEDGHQKAIFCFCALNAQKYPELKRLFAIPNGGSRHIAEATKFVAMGVKSGIPDMLLPVKRGLWAGLWIELKRPVSKGKKAGKPSDEQKNWIDFLLLQGYGCYIAYGWEDARDVLIAYLEQK